MKALCIVLLYLPLQPLQFAKTNDSSSSSSNTIGISSSDNNRN